jgi:hypothetical protein
MIDRRVHTPRLLMGWSGRAPAPLKTLREAVAYLAKAIPKAERDMPEVLAAAEMLTNAAERESAWRFIARLASCSSRSSPHAEHIQFMARGFD